MEKRKFSIFNYKLVLLSIENLGIMVNLKMLTFFRFRRRCWASRCGNKQKLRTYPIGPWVDAQQHNSNSKNLLVFFSVWWRFGGIFSAYVIPKNIQH